MTKKMIQQQYLSNWHDKFVRYIQGMLGLLTTLEVMPNATENDKHAFDIIKIMLRGGDVAMVEKDLANGAVSGEVKKETLHKIEKIDDDIADLCLEHIQMAPLVKEFWRQFAHQRFKQAKENEMEILEALKIPMVED